MTSIPATRNAISALKIEERVARDVKAGIPEIDRDSHTESEESLRAYVAREIIGKVHSDRQRELDEQVEARGAVDIRQLHQEVRTAGESAGKKMAGRFAVLARDLKRAARELSAQRMDVEIFRHRNGITREADYPESRVLHYAILFFIVIFETALNAFFLARGSELGLVGGFFQAFIISLVNLGLAAFIASALRNCFHRNPLRKVISAALFIGIGALACSFVLAVGHYREALEVDPMSASQVAVASLRAGPFTISDFNSWIMVVVSGIALILLTAKFFVADDRYPGYTAVTRRLRELQNRWGDLCAGAAEELDEVAEEACRELAEKEKQTRAQFISFKTSIERSEAIRSQYDEDIAKAQGLLDDLVRYYQSHSEKMLNRRSAYFGELLRFELETLPKLNATGLEQHKRDLGTFEEILQDLDRAYTSATDAIHRQCEALQAELMELIGNIERDNGLSGY